MLRGSMAFEAASYRRTAWIDNIFPVITVLNELRELRL